MQSSDLHCTEEEHVVEGPCQPYKSHENLSP